jgi:uncharacterized protein YggT (Ycf19 family)
MSTETSLLKATRTIWYIFGMIELLLIFRFVMRLLGANPAAAFTQFIYGLSGFFLAPFRYVFGTPSVAGSALELSTLLAVLVYAFIAWAIVRFLLLNRPVSRYEAHQELREEEA